MRLLKMSESDPFGQFSCRVLVGFFLPFSIVTNEEWKGKVLHCNEGNSLWKAFFFFLFLKCLHIFLYIFGSVSAALGPQPDR